MTGPEHARDRAEAAVARLDWLLAHRGEDAHQVLTEAARAAVAIRDGLIACRRRGKGSADVLRARLEEANLLVSTAVGAQFPVTGIHWDRVEKTRDGLRRMLG